MPAKAEGGVAPREPSAAEGSLLIRQPAIQAAPARMSMNKLQLKLKKKEQERKDAAKKGAGKTSKTADGRSKEAADREAHKCAVCMQTFMVIAKWPELANHCSNKHGTPPPPATSVPRLASPAVPAGSLSSCLCCLSLLPSVVSAAVRLCCRLSLLSSVVCRLLSSGTKRAAAPCRATPS